MTDVVKQLKKTFGIVPKAPNTITTEEEDDTAQTVSIVVSVLFVLGYLALNITGTVYYVKLTKLSPSPISKGLMDWNLASVILGYLLFPLLNLSSPITFASIKK